MIQKNPRNNVTYNYLLDVFFCSKDKLSYSDNKLIFIYALKDFFDKKIDIQELSDVATNIYYVLNKPFDIDSNYDSEFVNLLNNAAEADYNQNNLKNKRNRQLYEKLLSDLKRYLDQSKDLLKK